MNQKELSTQTILSLLALLIVAGVGLYVSTAQMQTAQQPTTPVDETAGWRTYRNEEHGFEFKYPPYTKIEEWEGMVVIRNVEGPPLTEVMTETPFDYFIQFGKTSAQTIDEWFADAYANRGDLSPSKTPTTFNGYPALVVSEPITLGGCDSEFIVTVHSGNVYRIQNPQCYMIANPRVSQIIEAINTTFKFIEPINTSDWQIYRNKGLGFEFKYPPIFQIVESLYSSEVGLYTPENFKQGIGPFAHITVRPLPVGSSLIQYIESFAVREAQVSEVLYGANSFLKWPSSSEEDPGTASYSKLISSQEVLTVTSYSPGFADSTEFSLILSSLVIR